jgi:hypothetical protein
MIGSLCLKGQMSTALLFQTVLREHLIHHLTHADCGARDSQKRGEEKSSRLHDPCLVVDASSAVKGR